MLDLSSKSLGLWAGLGTAAFLGEYVRYCLSALQLSARIFRQIIYGSPSPLIRI